MLRSLSEGLQKIVDYPDMEDDVLATHIMKLNELMEDSQSLAFADDLMRQFLKDNEARFLEVFGKLEDIDFEQSEKLPLLRWMKKVLVVQIIQAVNPPILFFPYLVAGYVLECRKSNLGIESDPIVIHQYIPGFFETICENLERGAFSEEGGISHSSEHYAGFLFSLEVLYKVLPHQCPVLKIRLKHTIRKFLKNHPGRVDEIRRVLMESSLGYKHDAIRILTNFQIMNVVDGFFAPREEASRKQPSNPHAGLAGASIGKVPYVTLPYDLEQLDPFDDYRKGIERHLPSTVMPMHNSFSEE